MMIKRHKEIILYLIFGVSTTAVNWIVYALLVKICGINMTAANASAWICAVLFAFVTNKLFVFESRSEKIGTVMREGAEFLGSRIISGLIEIAGPITLFNAGLNKSFFGIEGFAAKFVVSVFVVVLNYALSKLFVFKKS